MTWVLGNGKGMSVPSAMSVPFVRNAMSMRIAYALRSLL